MPATSVPARRPSLRHGSFAEANSLVVETEDPLRERRAAQDSPNSTELFHRIRRRHCPGCRRPRWACSRPRQAEAPIEQRSGIVIALAHDWTPMTCHDGLDKFPTVACWLGQARIGTQVRPGVAMPTEAPGMAGSSCEEEQESCGPYSHRAACSARISESIFRGGHQTARDLRTPGSRADESCWCPVRSTGGNHSTPMATRRPGLFPKIQRTGHPVPWIHRIPAPRRPGRSRTGNRVP